MAKISSAKKNFIISDNNYGKFSDCIVIAKTYNRNEESQQRGNR